MATTLRMAKEEVTSVQFTKDDLERLSKVVSSFDSLYTLLRNSQLNDHVEIDAWMYGKLMEHHFYELSSLGSMMRARFTKLEEQAARRSE